MAKRAIARPTGGAPRRRRRLSDYNGNGGSFEGSKDSLNILHQIYRGRFDRFERYRMFDWMDQDSDISRALDLIAEHCSEKDYENRFFQFDWITDEPTDELGEVLKAHMDQWSKINDIDKNLFKIVRNTMKYGDWFMFRDPYTFTLYDIHPGDVKSAMVDANTMDIIGWVINDFGFNIEDMEINVDDKDVQNKIEKFNSVQNSTNSGVQSKAIPAVHILHFSLSEGKMATRSMDGTSSNQYSNSWPFGQSWLEKAYKTFKQRELIEDASLIHRVQRAPTRNVWYIDTGKQRPDRASFTVENFKNELNQKRIPQFIGENSKTVDSVYNPISQLEDYYIPVSMDQRGSKVESLQGESWSDLPELEYFKKKMLAALRVPYAWLQPAGEGGIVPSDGRQGIATQEEIEFSRFCSRIHSYLRGSFDHEFKMYCNFRDVQANWADFRIMFHPPTDYEASRDRERLNSSFTTFTNMLDVPFIAKRTALKRGLGWSDDVIAENERLVDEETHQQEAMDNMDSMGGMGGLGPEPGMDPMGPGLEASGDGIGAIEGGVGGLDGGDMGAGMGDIGAGIGGAMESIEHDVTEFLLEDTLNLPSLKHDMSDVGHTADDPTVNGDDPVRGKPVATLAMIQKIRHAHFTKRVDWQKRLKTLNRIYAAPADDGGGLGGI